MWVLGWPQHLSAYSVCLAILSSVSVWLGPNIKENKLKGKINFGSWYQRVESMVCSRTTWQMSLFNLKWTGSRGGGKGSWKNMPLVAFFQLSATFQIFTVSQKAYQLGTKCWLEPMGSISEWNLIGMFKILPPGVWVSCGWAVGFNPDSSTFVLCFLLGLQLFKISFSSFIVSK